MKFFCKKCGSELDLVDGQSVCTCEVCGSLETIPSTTDDLVLKRIVKGSTLRSKFEFDKAMSIFNQLLEDGNIDAEIYWGLILCRYGITYVDDYDGSKKPTINRMSNVSITKDKDLAKILEIADKKACDQYIYEVKRIAKIQEEILSIIKKEEPYDIFISYKETDEFGDRTEDSVIAQDIYDDLTKEGYKVFLSRITLSNIAGQEYEPYIYSALYSSKVMVLVGTDSDYIDSVWVKNEWSRFLGMMSKNKEKHLIPCFKSIGAYDLPREIQNIQGVDFNKIGAIQDLRISINKILNKNVEAKQTSIKSSAPTMSKEEKEYWEEIRVYELSLLKGDSTSSKLSESLKLKYKNDFEILALEECTRYKKGNLGDLIDFLLNCLYNFTDYDLIGKDDLLTVSDSLASLCANYRKSKYIKKEHRKIMENFPIDKVDAILERTDFGPKAIIKNISQYNQYNYLFENDYQRHKCQVIIELDKSVYLYKYFHNKELKDYHLAKILTYIASIQHLMGIIKKIMIPSFDYKKFIYDRYERARKINALPTVFLFFADLISFYYKDEKLSKEAVEIMFFDIMGSQSEYVVLNNALITPKYLKALYPYYTDYCKNIRPTVAKDNAINDIKENTEAAKMCIIHFIKEKRKPNGMVIKTLKNYGEYEEKVKKHSEALYNFVNAVLENENGRYNLDYLKELAKDIEDIEASLGLNIFKDFFDSDDGLKDYFFNFNAYYYKTHEKGFFSRTFKCPFVTNDLMEEAFLAGFIDLFTFFNAFLYRDAMEMYNGTVTGIWGPGFAIVLINFVLFLIVRGIAACNKKMHMPATIIVFGVLAFPLYFVIMKAILNALNGNVINITSQTIVEIIVILPIIVLCLFSLIRVFVLSASRSKSKKKFKKCEDKMDQYLIF